MSNSRFTIEITETAIETGFTGREWVKGVDPENPEKGGYTPQVESKKKVSRVIYTQNLEDLDLTAVIKAVNGI